MRKLGDLGGALEQRRSVHNEEVGLPQAHVTPPFAARPRASLPVASDREIGDLLERVARLTGRYNA